MSVSDYTMLILPCHLFCLSAEDNHRNIYVLCNFSYVGIMPLTVIGVTRLPFDTIFLKYDIYNMLQLQGIAVTALGQLSRSKRRRNGKKMAWTSYLGDHVVGVHGRGVKWIT